jgi:type IV pilus assembly protein PilC
MYRTFGVKLPFIVTVLAQAERIINPISTIIAAVILMIGVWFITSWLRDNRNKELLGRFFLRVPVWGEMVKEGLLTHNFSTIALLLKSGVPLTESLNVVKDITSNAALRDVFASAALDVSEGKTLSENIVKQSIVPLEAAWIIRNGEINGNLVKALENAATMCESKFDFSSRLILSVLEPALLFAVGAVVVSIAIALFYPLYSISSHLGI